VFAWVALGLGCTPGSSILCLASLARLWIPCCTGFKAATFRLICCAKMWCRNLAWTSRAPAKLAAAISANRITSLASLYPAPRLLCDDDGSVAAPSHAQVFDDGGRDKADKTPMVAASPPWASMLLWRRKYRGAWRRRAERRGSRHRPSLRS
jgi:hypothetical protein